MSQTSRDSFVSENHNDECEFFEFLFYFYRKPMKQWTIQLVYLLNINLVCATNHERTQLLFLFVY